MAECVNSVSICLDVLYVVLTSLGGNDDSARRWFTSRGLLQGPPFCLILPYTEGINSILPDLILKSTLLNSTLYSQKYILIRKNVCSISYLHVLIPW